jgi:uncharacterized membrane protein (DUF4010 family)
MDLVDLFQRLGLAIAIGAAVGVERHWRERGEPEGGRTAGIRTFTLIGMTGGLAGLLETTIGNSPVPGVIVATFLIAVTIVMLRFELLQAEVEHSVSATTVIASITTFALGTLSVLGDMVVASAGGAAIVTVLASREFLHSAIRRLTWVELRSAVVLLAMSLVVLPLIPATPYGPFGGVSPRSLLILVILLASVSFVGYVAVRLLGSGQGYLVAGAVGGLVSSTATTVTLARESLTGMSARAAAAGAAAAGAVSLLRTGLLIVALAPALASVVLPPLVVAGAAMMACAVLFIRNDATRAEAGPPANPFELVQVVKMALLITVVAFVSRASAQVFGDAGLYIVSALSALADVDAATVTVTGMTAQLTTAVAVNAIGIAVVANLLAKVVYGAATGSRAFMSMLAFATTLAVAAGLVTAFAVQPP